MFRLIGLIAIPVITQGVSAAELVTETEYQVLYVTQGEFEDFKQRTLSWLLQIKAW